VAAFVKFFAGEVLPNGAAVIEKVDVKVLLWSSFMDFIAFGSRETFANGFL
jgi:hypothetical protein